MIGTNRTTKKMVHEPAARPARIAISRKISLAKASRKSTPRPILNLIVFEQFGQRIRIFLRAVMNRRGKARTGSLQLGQILNGRLMSKLTCGQVSGAAVAKANVEERARAVTETAWRQVQRIIRWHL